MSPYWIDFVKGLFPGLFFMGIAVLPLVIGTVVTAFNLRVKNISGYYSTLWGSTSAGLVTLLMLAGVLFGTEMSDSPMAGLIFFVVPFVSIVALFLGFGLGVLAYRRRTKLAEAVGDELKLSIEVRRYILIPIAIFIVLALGILRLSIQSGDLNIAEKASNPETLYKVYESIERGDEDSDGVALFLAQNPHTPPDVLAKLSKYGSQESPSIRIFVATNPNTPLDILVSLQNDSSEHVRKAAQDRLKYGQVPVKGN